MSEAVWAQRFRRAEPLLRRAPSAHNTQPWTVRLTAGGWEIGWDPDRELVVGDPTRRDLWLSLGAFVESAVIALAAQGIRATVRYPVPGSEPPATPPIVVITESHPPPPAADPAAAPRAVAETPAPHLPAAASGQNRYTAGDLLDRRTARGEYRPGGPGAADLTDLTRTAGTAGSLTLLPAVLVAELLDIAEPWSFRSPAQVAELRRWLRLRRGASGYHQDGLSDVALGLGRAQAFGLRLALTPRVWSVLRRLGGPRMLAAASGRPSGAVVVFSSPAADAADPPAMVGRGRDLLRLWLAAGRRGWRVHPLSVLLDCPASRRRLSDWVTARPADQPAPAPAVEGASNPDVPLAVFRIGAPKVQPALSARRPVPVVAE